MVFCSYWFYDYTFSALNIKCITLSNITWLNVKISSSDNPLVSDAVLGKENNEAFGLYLKFVSNMYQAWHCFSIFPKWLSCTKPNVSLWLESPSPLTLVLFWFQTPFKVSILILLSDYGLPNWKIMGNQVNGNERTWRFLLFCRLNNCLLGIVGLDSLPRMECNIFQLAHSRQENISWLIWQMTLNPALLLGNFLSECLAYDKFMYQIKKKLVPFDHKSKRCEVSQGFAFLF